MSRSGVERLLVQAIKHPDSAGILDKWLSKKAETANREADIGATAIIDNNDSRAVLNLTEARDRLMDNDVLNKDVIDVLIQDTPKRLLALKETLSLGDISNATLQSHSIKGAMSSVSAERMRLAAFEMEKACQTGEDLEKLKFMLLVLEQEFEALKLFAEKMSRSRSVQG
jgi:HPt (histidine-containing phosphotransfer) domain-containing protein